MYVQCMYQYVCTVCMFGWCVQITLFPTVTLYFWLAVSRASNLTYVRTLISRRLRLQHESVQSYVLYVGTCVAQHAPTHGQPWLYSALHTKRNAHPRERPFKMEPTLTDYGLHWYVRFNVYVCTYGYVLLLHLLFFGFFYLLCVFITYVCFPNCSTPCVLTAHSS